MRGNNIILTSKLHIFQISWFHFNGFSCDLHNRDSFDQTFKMRGNNLMLTWKMHILSNILAQYQWIFKWFLEQGLFWRDNQNEGQQHYTNFKTACFVKYLTSMLMDFLETSITGIHLMRHSKWGATTLCWFENCTFC